MILSGADSAPDKITDAIQKQPAELAAFKKLLGHLEKNEIDLASTPFTFGSETGFRDANHSREMRAPYTLA